MSDRTPSSQGMGGRRRGLLRGPWHGQDGGGGGGDGAPTGGSPPEGGSSRLPGPWASGSAWTLDPWYRGPREAAFGPRQSLPCTAKSAQLPLLKLFPDF